MAVAFLSAQRSKDPNKQVGAVIVGPDAVILSIGYNGFPRGCPDGALPWAKRSRGGGPLATKYPYVVHAEANALLNKNHASVAGAKVYVTMFPCNECAKLLIQAGVREVVYHEAKAEGPAAAAAAAAAVGNGGSSGGGANGCGGDGSGGCSDGHACNGHAACGGDGFPGFPAPNSSGSSGSGNSSSSGGDECRNGGSGGGEGWGALGAGYVASRRLLTMAGVQLRQHRLKSTIVVNPATD
jgi:dCMP deaminase